MKQLFLFIIGILCIVSPLTICAQEDQALKELMGFARALSGGSPTKYLDDEVKPFKATQVNFMNSNGGFRIQGTVRPIELKQSKFKGIKETVRKGGVVNGCFNTYSVTLNYGDKQEMTKFVPKGLKNFLTNYHGKGSVIDLNVTNGEKYVCIIKDNNTSKVSYQINIDNFAPSDLVKRLKSLMNLPDYRFLSVSFNDKGKWAITCYVSTVGPKVYQHFADSETTEELNKIHGPIETITMTDTGFIACGMFGVYLKDVPSSVYNVLKTISFKPYFVKFHDSGHYLITNGDGKAITNL